MSIWLRWRGEDGKRRWHAIEGLQDAVALVAAVAVAALYLAVVLLEQLFGAA